MPTLLFDDDYDENENIYENENIEPHNIQYSVYEKTIDREVTPQEYANIRSHFELKPMVRPHKITQDFLNNGYPVVVDTKVFLSLDKTRVIKDIEISYHITIARQEPHYRKNLELYLGKIMNEIKMQSIATTLQEVCKVKVPRIYEYGRILDGNDDNDNNNHKMTTTLSKSHILNKATAATFGPLKRADSMDFDKKMVHLFIEMEFIADSQELTKLIRQSKSKCREYKQKLNEIYACLTAHHFSHGDMKTLDNILVNTKTGEFALIDYGQSSISIEGQTLDKIGDIDCDAYSSTDTLSGGKRNDKKTRTKTKHVLRIKKSKKRNNKSKLNLKNLTKTKKYLKFRKTKIKKQKIKKQKTKIKIKSK